ncbi:MAG: ABC transporter permease, partial [Alphaproteobacteria bacterium]
MATALRRLRQWILPRRGDAPASGVCARNGWLGLVPALTLALFLAPVGAGLIGTWLPAAGYLPALGGTSPSLAPARTLLDHPALAGALRLTLTSGFLATSISLLLALGCAASLHGQRIFMHLHRGLGPLLAVPHVAVAIGLAFLLAPSGWLVRLVSPWPSGWTTPPDVATVQDPYGLGLAFALIIKETPYLLLMIVAALDLVRADERLAVVRALGYGPVTAWFKIVLPAIYPLIRLPVYAVLAFSLSVVDMALILAPLTPPPLAVLVFRWFN